MKTEELLKQADLPWRLERNETATPVLVQVVTASGQIVADNEPYYPQAITPERAELIARAVNSFEAMQEALWRSLIYLKDRAPNEYRAAKAALALAEGEEWEVNPRWAENNQPLTRKKP